MAEAHGNRGHFATSKRAVFLGRLAQALAALGSIPNLGPKSVELAFLQKKTWRKRMGIEPTLADL